MYSIIMARIISTILLVFASAACLAQVSLTGCQERIPNFNAELRCEGLSLTRSMRIDSVSGFHNGFWIVKGSKTEKAFWTEQYLRTAIGYVLKPGTYYVYPNLRQDCDTASVTIWLKNN